MDGFFAFVCLFGILFFFPLCYIILSVTISIVIGRKKKASCGWLALAVLLAAPFTDQLIVKCLFTYYKHTQVPLEMITRTVEYPESVYWKDSAPYHRALDVYSKAIAAETLDGKHLSTLAIRMVNGKILLYRQSKNYEPRIIFDKDNKPLQSRIFSPIAEPAIYLNEADLPQMNYEVEIDLLPIGCFAKLFIYADIIRITDNRTKEVIAYSKRYLSYTPVVQKVNIYVNPLRGKFAGGISLMGANPGFNLPWVVLFQHGFNQRFSKELM